MNFDDCCQQGSERPEVDARYKLHHAILSAVYRDDIKYIEEQFKVYKWENLDSPGAIDIHYIVFKLQGDDSIGQYGDTIIHQAARFGRTKPVEVLLKHYLAAKDHEIKTTSLSAVLNQLLNRKGETILHAAASSGRPHVVEAIFTSLYNHQPLLSATEIKARQRIRRASSVTRGGIDLDDFINFNQYQLEKRTALHLTTCPKSLGIQIESLEEYLNNGCYGGISASPGYGYGSSMQTSGQAMVADLLLHHGGSVDEIDMHGLNPFHLAVINGNLELCKLLYSNSPNLVNEPTCDGWSMSPLHLAIKQAAIMAQETASTSTSTSTSASTMRGYRQNSQHLDTLERHLDVVHWLLQSGVDRKWRDSAGRLAQQTLLYNNAAPFERKELVRVLNSLGLHQ